jgi:hypothetical protein
VQRLTEQRIIKRIEHSSHRIATQEEGRKAGLPGNLAQFSPAHKQGMPLG